MAETVKTYRVLRDGMRVGDSVRDFGDFMPEAAEFPTLRTLLNTAAIEEVYVEKKAIDDWRAEQDKRDKRRMEALESGDVYDPDEDDSDEDEEIPEVEETSVAPTPKKKRKVAKKKVAKKTEKEQGNGTSLAEESV
jgi:hypothetical protein